MGTELGTGWLVAVVCRDCEEELEEPPWDPRAEPECSWERFLLLAWHRPGLRLPTVLKSHSFLL